MFIEYFLITMYFIFILVGEFIIGEIYSDSYDNCYTDCERNLTTIEYVGFNTIYLSLMVYNVIYLFE